jgi:hypothetical protein
LQEIEPLRFRANAQRLSRKPVPTFPDRALGSPRGFQRLRRVDIEEGTKALDRDFRRRLAMPGDQMAGADVAVERHQLVEETARPQDRIAAPAVADRHRDQIAAVRRERLRSADRSNEAIVPSRVGRATAHPNVEPRRFQ